jgi:hypothetical protein
MLTVTLIKTGGGMHGGMNVRSTCMSGKKRKNKIKEI